MIFDIKLSAPKFFWKLMLIFFLMKSRTGYHTLGQSIIGTPANCVLIAIKDQSQYNKTQEPINTQKPSTLKETELSQLPIS